MGISYGFSNLTVISDFRLSLYIEWIKGEFVLISEIEVKNIKGIDELKIQSNIYPNKVHMFVAPNGFGKTSLSVAFDALSKGKIELEEKDLHLGNSDLEPKVILQYDAPDIGLTELQADKVKNDINKIFDVFVINSQLYPEARVIKYGAFSGTNPRIAIKGIELYNNIPDKAEFDYRFKDIKRLYGEVSKVFENLQSSLKNYNVSDAIYIIRDTFNKVLEQKKKRELYEKYKEKLNAMKGSKAQLSQICFDFSELQDIPDFSELLNLTKYIIRRNEDDIVTLANMYQVIEVVTNNRGILAKINKYNRYENSRREVDKLIADFNSTRLNIKAKKEKKRLVINFPKAHELSNGERDIMCFVGRLFECEFKRRKDRLIIMIDEIFDYLDDANLIAAQYYLEKYIANCKNIGVKVYPIIMTHIDPDYFKTYRFKVKNVHYLTNDVVLHNKYNFHNVLKARSRRNNCLSEDFAKYYLHFNPNECDMATELQQYSLASSIHKASDFRSAMKEEVENYVSNKKYDIAMVCCGLRLIVEEQIYKQVTSEYQEEYLNTHKTQSKLDFAEEVGVEVNEMLYLLGIIYNEAMHLDDQAKKLKPIGNKLKHPVIYKMISDVYEDYKKRCIETE